jgi:hypothetical protein
VISWPWRRNRTVTRSLRLRSRGDFGDVDRVAFETLAPELDTFLGQATYLQLGFAETLSALIAPTLDLSDKESLAIAAGAALDTHRRLVALIRERGDDPLDLMLPFREPLDEFRRATHGARPLETMLSVHLTAGMLDDFYLALSSSYGETGERVAEILRDSEGRQSVRRILTDAIESDAEWRALLALWGRRLVGDTLLIARGALRPRILDAAEEQKVEPVFTALLAAHSRRMAELGLDA